MDIEDIISKPKELTTEQLNLIRDELLKKEFDTIFNFIKDMNKKFKINCSKIDLIKIYNSLAYEDYDLKKKLIKKVQKSQSGIISVTVLTSGTPEYINSCGEVVKGTFSCLHNCSYCPNEKPSEDNGWVQQPRSYLFTEPAVLRANQNGFDPIRQMNARISSLINMGHQVDKIELLVLGGTWSEYPKEYQEQFITKLYYAANIFYEIEKRDVLSLEEELLINETAKIHIIGLTLEMRSDSININEIKRLRRFNCTRVQLGIQHTDNEVLKMNNRGESVEKVKKAIKLLKDNCYKIDGHIMLNLYGSSVEKDEIMLNQILNDPELQLDQLKIYPCAIVPFTKIKELYEKGEYKPYEDKYLYELIKNFKIKITKQFRINRIIRDISGHYIIGGYSQQFTSIRQVLENDMRANEWKCHCIRCREIKGNVVKYEDIKLEILEYTASDGKEFFISFETDKYLIGFIRLRIINVDIVNQGTVLENCGLIRELHVYSTLSNVGNNDSFSLQHKGYGRKLIEKAEEITKSYGIQKMAIIAGTGVRNYYRKYGYELVDTYMIKLLK
uniref:tRNA carboxymethyluridine synthase n=1 Tax=viral metagenome TaxID=1070528 RepID=A0A6C0CF04_9ZZZZ